MGAVTISRDRRSFLRDGKPFPYLADTAWSTFTNTQRAEWKDYLKLRREQGFTAIQMNVLPQWDRAGNPDGPADERQPFEIVNGNYSFDKPEEAYFAHVEQMLDDVVSLDLVPAIVILWANYVPGNCHTGKTPGNQIPRNLIAQYVEYVLARLAVYEPVLIVSGDTDFPGPEPVEWYLDALEVCKQTAPNLLTTLHTTGRTYELPDSILESPHLDFYMFQSGHYHDQARVPVMTRSFRSLPPRPVVNGEICYEGMGRFGSSLRFTSADIRSAIWMSILNGANAGIGYGASGIWNWHRSGATYAWSASLGQSLTVDEGLSLPGAWDIGYTRWLYDLLGLYDLEPNAAPGPQPPEDEISPPVATATIRSTRRWIAYAGTPMELELPAEVQPDDLTVIDLETRRIHRVQPIDRDDRRLVLIPPVERDSLVIGWIR